MTITSEVRPARTMPPRVLIVDDTADLRSLLRIKLSAVGAYTVVGEASNGVDAIRQAEDLQPELILLDLAMPQMNGLEALPLIRDAAPRARVIVLTVFHADAFEDQVLAAGADRYVVKGCSMRDLMQVIDTVTKPA